MTKLTAKGAGVRNGSGDFPSPLPLTIRDEFLHVPANSRLLCEGIAERTQPARRAVFLDRDGVLNEDVNHLTSTDQIRMLPDAADAICRLQPIFSIIVVTNQSAIARGLLNEEGLMEIHRELVSLFASGGAMVDALYYCPHLPEGTVPAYSMECSCRKPKPGMLHRAVKDFGIDLSGSFLVGDRHTDIQAGDAAGVHSILLMDDGEASVETPVIAGGISEAADLILAAIEHIDFNPVDVNPAVTGHAPKSNDSVVKRGSLCH